MAKLRPIELRASYAHAEGHKIDSHRWTNSWDPVRPGRSPRGCGAAAGTEGDALLTSPLDRLLAS
jgi:hypothetical protein